MQMELPSITPVPPPPSYSEITEGVLSEGVPNTPPPPYTEPGVSQNPNRATIDPFPVLNQFAIVNQSQQVVLHPPAAPQVIVVEPPCVLGNTPTVTVCRYCHKNILTTVQYKPGAAAWGLCCLLTLLGLVCGCCLIPFFVRGIQDVHHTCPYCRRHLGVRTY